MDRYSAIDVGSNAIRMIIVEQEELSHKKFRVLKKFRAPLRLGEEVFLNGRISPEAIQSAQQIFEEFSKKNRKFKVQKCKAVATSASREATNSRAFIEAVKKASGIEVEVIDGVQEAHLIHLAVKKRYDLSEKNTMLVDIGGGSVEVSFSQNAQLISTQSFALGTVRLLDELKRRQSLKNNFNVLISEHLGELTNHIHAHIDRHPVRFAIGTGGNLEYLIDLRNLIWPKRIKKYFTYGELLKMIDLLRSMSVKERIEKLGMKKDRADVIVPASLVLQTILHQAEVDRIYIPKVGLREGVIWSLL